MAIQEIDLNIQYRTGQFNIRANALSRYLIQCSAEALVAQVNATQPKPGHDQEENQEASDLKERQHTDPDLWQMVNYLEQGELPECEKKLEKWLLEGPNMLW